MNGDKTQPAFILNSRQNLNALVESILDEPFTKEKALDELTLQEIGELLERERDRFENEANIFLEDQSPTLKDSFIRTKEIYCSILLELNHLDLEDLLFQNLISIREREAELSLVDPTPPLSHSESAAPVEDETGGGLDSFAGNLTIENKPLLSTAPSDSDAPPLYVEINEEGSVAPKEMGSNFSSPSTKGYLELASYLRSHLDKESILSDAQRLVGVSFCFALESECTEKFSSAIAEFWTKREAAIRLLLNLDSKQFDFSIDLKRVLTVVASDFKVFLHEQALPMSSLLNSVRYLYLSRELSKTAFSLIDFASLFLLFSQEKLGDLKLNRIFYVNGLSEAETVELSFRIMRMHKIRSRLLQMSYKIEPDILSNLEVDLFRVLKLFEQVHLTGAEEPPAHQEQEQLRVA